MSQSKSFPILTPSAVHLADIKDICSLLKLIAEIAFESRPCIGHGDGSGSSADTPDVLFGPPSEDSAWSGAMEKLDMIGNGERLREEIQSQHDLAAKALGFDLGLTGTPGQRSIDYDKWVRPADVHLLYAPDRRQHYVEDAIFVRVHQLCEGILEALLVELDEVEAALFKADYPAAEKHVLTASRFLRPFECAINLLGEMSQIDYSPLRVALRDASGIQSARARRYTGSSRSVNRLPTPHASPTRRCAAAVSTYLRRQTSTLEPICLTVASMHEFPR